jgi:hypothetical protein
VYGKNAFTSRDYLPGESRPRIALNELLQLAFPYRVAEKITQPGPSKYYGRTRCSARRG